MATPRNKVYGKITTIRIGDKKFDVSGTGLRLKDMNFSNKWGSKHPFEEYRPLAIAILVHAALCVAAICGWLDWLFTWGL